MPRRSNRPAGPRSADPDRLVRQAAGSYRTADGRFEVRDGGTGWFLVDTEQTNDFGQELIQGPFSTLAAIGEAIPPARSAKVTPIRPVPLAPKETSSGQRAAGQPDAHRRAKPGPKAAPATWLDRLPRDEAAAARRAIRALERLGLRNAEDLVRRDREGIGPAIATRLIEARLEEIVAEIPERGRTGARELVRRAAEILSAEGGATIDGLPGWALVEIGPEPEPPNRRITIRELPG